MFQLPLKTYMLTRDLVTRHNLDSAKFNSIKTMFNINSLIIYLCLVHSTKETQCSPLLTKEASAKH